MKILGAIRCALANILFAALAFYAPSAIAQFTTNDLNFASDPTLIEQDSDPLAEPTNVLDFSPLVSMDSAQYELTEPGNNTVTHELSIESNFAMIDSATAISDGELNLFLETPWPLDPLLDARTSIADFNGQLETERPSSLVGRLWDDQKHFYSPESLTLLGGGLVVGGLMANTSIDDAIQRHFQSSVRGATSDEWFEALRASKEIGNGMYTLPVFATAWAAGELFPDNKFVETSGRWGERSIRGFLVGAPPLIIMQQLTGGSRPTETDESSEWHPMRDNNGVSGHAFMGSLPFITAAKMTDHRGYKFLFFAASTIAPLSRVNDNAHYPSQVALGWWMAYLSASAIDATDDPNSRWRFYPYSTGNDSGMMAEFRF